MDELLSHTTCRDNGNDLTRSRRLPLLSNKLNLSSADFFLRECIEPNRIVQVPFSIFWKMMCDKLDLSSTEFALARSLNQAESFLWYRVQSNRLLQDAPASAYGPTVDLLCSWGQHEHLLGAVVDSLKRAFLDPGSVMTGREEADAVDEDPAASDQAGVGVLADRVGAL